METATESKPSLEDQINALTIEEVQRQQLKETFLTKQLIISQNRLIGSVKTYLLLILIATGAGILLAMIGAFATAH